MFEQYSTVVCLAGASSARTHALLTPSLFRTSLHGSTSQNRRQLKVANQ